MYQDQDLIIIIMMYVSISMAALAAIRAAAAALVKGWVFLVKARSSPKHPTLRRSPQHLKCWTTNR